MPWPPTGASHYYALPGIGVAMKRVSYLLGLGSLKAWGFVLGPVQHTQVSGPLLWRAWMAI